MRSIGFDMLAFVAKPYASTRGACQDWKISCQMSQQSRLLLWTRCFIELIKIFSWNSELRRHKSNRREYCLVIRPHKKRKADVVENDQEKWFSRGLNSERTQLNHISVPLDWEITFTTYYRQHDVILPAPNNKTSYEHNWYNCKITFCWRERKKCD